MTLTRRRFVKLLSWLPAVAWLPWGRPEYYKPATLAHDEWKGAELIDVWYDEPPNNMEIYGRSPYEEYFAALREQRLVWEEQWQEIRERALRGDPMSKSSVLIAEALNGRLK
jgi:hypothetical protein